VKFDNLETFEKGKPKVTLGRKATYPDENRGRGAAKGRKIKP